MGQEGIWAWDYTNNKWVKAAADENGILQVYDPKVGSLISYKGTTTADGAPGGATLVDTVLTTKPDYNGNLVIITSGDYEGQARDINGATTGGTVTPASNFGGKIVSGVTFVIVGIRTTPAEVAAIEAKLDHAAHGLAALKTLLDAILLDTGITLEAKLDAIEALLDPEIANLLGDVGDASASTLGSLYAILGNPPVAIEHSMGHIPKYTGAIWFVDGTNGSDTNTGTDPNDAFATIGHAIGAASAGDRIYVMAGAYDEALNMNVAGLELVCEQGTILSNTTPGTVLIASANYCRVLGAIVSQAGQTGLQITGNFCSMEDCLAFGCATGFDDDGAENHFNNCRSILHTTTGFDISAGYGQYERLVATGAAAVRGIYLSNAAADHNHFFNCHTLGNTTAGWEIVAGANNNMFSHCSTGAADGAKVDAGTNNTWDDFSEGSQIVAGQTRDQDLKDIYDDVAAIETKLDTPATFKADVSALALEATVDAVEAKLDKTLFSMDFWSDTQEELLINATAGDKSLPKVFVEDLPGTATIVRAIAMFKFRMVENVFDGANAINVAQHIQVQNDTPGTWRDAISIADNLFNFAAKAREGGDILIGDHDIAVEVDENDGYNFQWHDADADQISINFNDIQCGLRIWYSV